MPGPAAGRPLGQPGAVSFRDHVTVMLTEVPGASRRTEEAPPGWQSSEDHTRAPPEVTVSESAFAPTSRRQGTVPVLRTLRVRVGRTPAGYRVASVVTVTATAESGHSGASAGGVEATVVDGFGPGLDAAVGPAVLDGFGPPEAVLAVPPPPGHSHRRRRTTASTRRSTSARRVQYTDAGRGPAGLRSVPTPPPYAGRAGGRSRHADHPRAWHDSPVSAAPDAAGRLVADVLAWYEPAARDLPWRRAGTTPWGVLVSEVMAQQTPVARVAPVWSAWLQRWPDPAALAAEPSGEAIRAWGRLGYPRRALRLHACAVQITERHGGVVPSAHADLLALPGIGAYTAAAVASFAFGQRHVVLDTNVRRVLARTLGGCAGPPASLGVPEVRRAAEVLPDDDADAVRWAVASMELGALVCTARAPRCGFCPVAASCRWRAAGYPASDAPSRRPQAFAGTDRQVRGILLAALRASSEPMAADELEGLWADDEQRRRALGGLVADGLVEPLPGARYALPR